MRALLLFLLLASAAPARTQSLPRVPIPPGNEPTAAKVRLGAVLFWDEQLSSSGTVACGTCHLPEGGGSDPRPAMDPNTGRHPGFDGVLGTADDRLGSIGVPERNESGAAVRDGLFGDEPQVTDRRPRTVIGAAYMTSTFWDARASDVFYDPETGEEVLPWAASLETQSLAPLLSPVEMGAHGRQFGHVVRGLFGVTPLAMSPLVPEELERWIDGRGYPELFEEAFGSDEMSAAQFAMAVASYERTLIPDQAPILRRDASLSTLELEGFRVFRRNGCADCHDTSRGLFSDQALHFIGQVDPDADPGLGLLTGDPGDYGLFMTPTLLNVELRAPYFHDGSKATLDEVLDFYSRGGDFGPANEREIGPANFTPAERRALRAFLGRPLTDPRVARASGPFQRPLLSTEASVRQTPPIRGISGPGGTPLASTASLVRAEVHRPFLSSLPAETDLIDHRGWIRIEPIATEDLMAMAFDVPPVVPVETVFIGTSVLAELRPLFANRTMRSSVILSIRASLDAPPLR